MTNITEGTWPTTAARTRLVVLRLWDGRCGHCGVQLIRNELNPSPPPFEVDHYVPRSHGGIDHPSNYIAACHECNHTRSDGPVPDREVIPRMAKIASFVRSDDFDEFVHESMSLDHSISDGALMVTVKCFEHDWHLEHSPEAVRCFELCTRGLPLDYRNTEWWSRFGQLSAYVLAAVHEYLDNASLNHQDWRGLHLDLPRYANSPYTALSTLDAMACHGIDSLTPAHQWFTYGRMELSATNESKAHTRSMSLDVNHSFEFWKDHGVKSIELLRFWMNNSCPTHLLADYPDAVEHIQSTGVRKHIRALSEFTPLPHWHRARAFEQYLSDRSERQFL